MRCFVYILMIVPNIINLMFSVLVYLVTLLKWWVRVTLLHIVTIISLVVLLIKHKFNLDNANKETEEILASVGREH